MAQNDNTPGPNDARDTIEEPSNDPNLSLLNPFHWLQKAIFAVFGKHSPPEFVSDFLPLAPFYNEVDLSYKEMLVFLTILAILVSVLIYTDKYLASNRRAE